MPEKKDPGRYTLRFNPDDPQQRTVIELLNRQGRLKAQFLTGAVLHYIHCPETPELPPMPILGKAEIEKIVLAILDARSQQSRAEQDRVPAAPAEVRRSELTPPPDLPDGLPEDLAELFGPDGMAAIASTVAAFQQE